MLYACSISVLLITSSPFFAAHPLITDDTGTQGKGKFQLEVNREYGYDKEEGVTIKTTQSHLSVLAGITYRF